jgi:hypothetical protein
MSSSSPYLNLMIIVTTSVLYPQVSAHSLMIEWRPPLDDGGETILGYSVEMSEGGAGWPKFTIRGLTEGATYFFRYETFWENNWFFIGWVGLAIDSSYCSSAVVR